MAMTYVEALNVAIESVADVEVAEKLTALKAQIAKKKGSTKPTKVQVANEAIKDRICEILADANEAMTVTEIAKSLNGEFTNQKISALLRQMVEAERVTKTIEKKVSRFALA